MLRGRGRLGAALAAAVLAAAGAAFAALPQQSGTVDLLTQANVRIDGAEAGDVAGEQVAGAGDVNGDGIDDVIIGAAFGDAAFVVFGRADQVTIDLASLGAAGFKITGVNGSQFGDAVDGAGDMNGDGRADVIISASTAAKAFVVFGKADGATVDTASLGSGGFVIDKADGDVAGAGDVNGDGVPDVLVGRPTHTYSARNTSGAAYVVFGKGSATGVDLDAIGNGGYVIGGASANHSAGDQVDGGQDVNGDGTPDQIVSAQGAAFNGRNGSGAVYVAFGKASAADVDLNVAASGFRIDGQRADDALGRSVALTGDMNGDGRSEAVAGSSFADNPSGDTAVDQSTGSAYVVFGKASNAAVDTAASGWGFRIDGVNPGDEAARNMAGGGDVNGDGRADVIVGALFADSNGRNNSGSLYAVYGKPGTETVDLSALGAGGFRADGAAVADSLGRGAGGAGDFNGDGRFDVIGGAEFADPNGRNAAGSSFVIYGFGAPAVTYPTAALDLVVGTPMTAVAPSQVRRTGTASFAIDPALPAGLTLDPATGAISGTPAAVHPATSHIVTMTDLAGSATAPLSVTVAAQPSGQQQPPPPQLLPGRCANVRRGTAAADVLRGTVAGDRLVGLGGNDLLSGLAGADCLDGGPGRDRLSGGSGADRLSGGSGNDFLAGGAGRDALLGGAGADRLGGGAARDSFDAGAGNDVINARDRVRETVRCGRGRDRVIADRRDRVRGCERVSRR